MSKVGSPGIGRVQGGICVFGGGGGMRGDARVGENGFVRASILKFMSEVSMMPYLRLG